MAPRSSLEAPWFPGGVGDFDHDGKPDLAVAHQSGGSVSILIGDGAGAAVDRMVLRMEPSESIVETSRKREFQLIRAMDGVVPVPGEP